MGCGIDTRRVSHFSGQPRCRHAPIRQEESRGGKKWGSTGCALVTGVQTCALPISSSAVPSNQRQIVFLGIIFILRSWLIATEQGTDFRALPLCGESNGWEDTPRRVCCPLDERWAAGSTRAGCRTSAGSLGVAMHQSRQRCRPPRWNNRESSDNSRDQDVISPDRGWVVRALPRGGDWNGWEDAPRRGCGLLDERGAAGSTRAGGRTSAGSLGVAMHQSRQRCRPPRWNNRESADNSRDQDVISPDRGWVEWACLLP